MSRLILVPQYPSKLRYQEWWYTEFPKQYSEYFDEVLVLGQGEVDLEKAPDKDFSPMKKAIEFEMQQVKEYLNIDLRRDDCLLLCDISYPGIFSNVLFHKRPSKCFAVCHATSKNKYDYFQKDRAGKWKTESGYAKLFDAIFVGTEYHKQKLGWNNTTVTALPLPPADLGGKTNKDMIHPLLPIGAEIVSIARPGRQKRNLAFERALSEKMGITIIHINNLYPRQIDWKTYFNFLKASNILLITAQEETFGYQIVDAVLNGCIPVAPKICSYPELLPAQYLYSDIEEATSIISYIQEGRLSVPELLNKEMCETFFSETSWIMQGVKE